MFIAFDTDQDGWIDAGELRRALAHCEYDRLSNYPVFFR